MGCVFFGIFLAWDVVGGEVGGGLVGVDAELFAGVS